MSLVFPDSNFPILEHLTYAEAHKFLRGLWVGFAVGLYLYADRRAAAVALVERVHKRQQSKHQDRETDDRLRGLKRDAWYVFSGGVFGFAVVVVGVMLVRGGVPRVL